MSTGNRPSTASQASSASKGQSDGGSGKPGPIVLSVESATKKSDIQLSIDTPKNVNLEIESNSPDPRIEIEDESSEEDKELSGGQIKPDKERHTFEKLEDLNGDDVSVLRKAIKNSIINAFTIRFNFLKLKIEEALAKTTKLVEKVQPSSNEFDDLKNLNQTSSEKKAQLNIPQPTAGSNNTPAQSQADASSGTKQTLNPAENISSNQNPLKRFFGSLKKKA